MKKKNQSANGRYISVEKLQQALSNICLEVAEGNEPPANASLQSHLTTIY